MSQVLNALQRSEQEHYNQVVNSQRASTLVGAVEKDFSWPVAVFFFILPSLCAVSYFSAQYYQRYVSEMSQPIEKVQRIDAIAVDHQLNSVVSNVDLVNVPKKRAVMDAASVSDSYTLLPEAQRGESSEPKFDSDMTEIDPLSHLDLSQFSPEIAQRVKAAMSTPSSITSEVRSTTAASSALVAFEQNSLQYQGRLPAMNFQTHVYSSREDKRWVKINDVEYVQGDELSSGVILESIEPQACVLFFDGERLRIPALYDWQG
ncbi:general secretion pathway protein GspB [Vibrio sp. FNV 38]|nr:general secretion pathway protein GspB [Vibrio sp. FNV 38]